MFDHEAVLSSNILDMLWGILGFQHPSHATMSNDNGKSKKHCQTFIKPLHQPDSLADRLWRILATPEFLELHKPDTSLKRVTMAAVPIVERHQKVRSHGEISTGLRAVMSHVLTWRRMQYAVQMLVEWGLKSRHQSLSPPCLPFLFQHNRLSSI